MSTGLIALLDDVAGLAKVAAASLDDTVGQAARAGAKAAGVVIDDAAVTPRYVVGFSADRELPIVGKIAVGSLRNKLLYLLPAALALSLMAPWLITPLLMLGGAYLCFEGAEKVIHSLRPHGAQGHAARAEPVAESPQALEDRKVRSAIQTDLILSAEIMAITLGTVPDAGFMVQAVVLAAVGIGITGLVYGGVALIVKADDAGRALAHNSRPASSVLGLRGAAPGQPPTRADQIVRPVTRALGRGLVVGMPVFLRVLGVVGTAAMVWVGGGIIIHGLEELGFPALAHLVHSATALGHGLPIGAGAAEWLVGAAVAGVFGLLVGSALVPVVQRVAVPALHWAKSRVARGGSDARAH